MTPLLRFQLIGAALCCVFVFGAVATYSPNDDTMSIILGVIAVMVGGVVFFKTATSPNDSFPPVQS